jgi:hypothetical protein
MPFGIDRSRLDAITYRHADALEAAERTVLLALLADQDVSEQEMIAVVKWLAAVRFGTMVQGEGRTPNHGDFIQLTDAVCEVTS